MSDTQKSSEKRYQQFLDEAIALETVWGLSESGDFACCASNLDGENEDDASDVLVFWSIKQDATKVRDLEFPDYQPEAISLFDFMFLWLPNMDDDGTLAGVNWDQDLIGFELTGEELQQELSDAMPDDMVDAYFAQLEERMATQNAEPK